MTIKTLLIVFSVFMGLRSWALEYKEEFLQATINNQMRLLPESEILARHANGPLWLMGDSATTFALAVKGQTQAIPGKSLAEYLRWDREIHIGHGEAPKPEGLKFLQAIFPGKKIVLWDLRALRAERLPAASRWADNFATGMISFSGGDILDLRDYITNGTHQHSFLEAISARTMRLVSLNGTTPLNPAQIFHYLKMLAKYTPQTLMPEMKSVALGAEGIDFDLIRGTALVILQALIDQMVAEVASPRRALEVVHQLGRSFEMKFSRAMEVWYLADTRQELGANFLWLMEQLGPPDNSLRNRQRALAHKYSQEICPWLLVPSVPRGPGWIAK
jgi:hypothetical protein